MTTTHRNTARALEVLALIIALSATISLFSLPIVFHFVIKNDSSSDLISYLGNSTTSNSSNTSCTELSWSVQSLLPNISSADCTATSVIYSDSVCTPYLTDLYICSINKSGSDNAMITVTTDRPQTTIDNEIVSLLTLLGSFPDCKVVALPFLCQYYFPLRDCSKGNDYTATREYCLFISQTVCKAPWQQAIAFGFDDRLPNCNSLSFSTNSSMDTNDNDTNTYTNNSNNTNIITCRDDFDLINNACLPRCDKFDSNSKAATTTLISSEIVAVSIGLCVCFLIILFSIPNYKNMLSIPSVFLLFLVANYIGTAVVVIVSAIDRNGLYCQSINLLDSLKSPTVFCSISGAVLHYVFVSMTLWWFLHIAVFLYKVLFPFHARQFQKDKRMKLLYFVVIIIGVMAPLVAVIVTLSTDGYHLTRFPPSICSPGGDIFFYSVTLMNVILMGTGVCFLITIFWIIHTNQHFRLMNHAKKRLTTAEKKIMIVFMSFIIFGVYTLIQTGVVSAHVDNLVNGLEKYLSCELGGHVPGKCDRTDFEKYSYPYLLAVSYILLGFIPLSILNFVINVRVTKTFVKKYFKTGREIDSVGVSFQTTSTSVSSSNKSQLKEDIL